MLGSSSISQKCSKICKMVKVGNDQEMAQSEINSHSKTEVGILN